MATFSWPVALNRASMSFWMFSQMAVAIGAQDDEALDAGVLHQLGLDADVGVPLCKVFFLAGDRLHELLVVFCHFVISS